MRFFGTRKQEPNAIPIAVRVSEGTDQDGVRYFNFDLEVFGEHTILRRFPATGALARLRGGDVLAVPLPEVDP